MHITSFEISKKLKEIGFKLSPEELIHAIYLGFDAEGEDIYGYCLETILDALPMGIDRGDKRYNLIIEQRVFFSYSDDDGNELEEFSIMQEGEESLADTAARLLIKLHEAGIVEFKEE